MAALVFGWEAGKSVISTNPVRHAMPCNPQGWDGVGGEPNSLSLITISLVLRVAPTTLT